MSGCHHCGALSGVDQHGTCKACGAGPIVHFASSNFCPQRAYYDHPHDFSVGKTCRYCGQLPPVPAVKYELPKDGPTGQVGGRDLPRPALDPSDVASSYGPLQRLVDVVDEFMGLQPLMDPEDLLTTLERGIFELRQQLEQARTRSVKEREVLACLSLIPDETLDPRACSPGSHWEPVRRAERIRREP